MLFNSLQYAAFLLVVFALYWTIPRQHRRALLLVASYVFYGSWDYRLLGLLVLVTAGSWLSGRAMPGTDGLQRKLIAGAGIVTSLSVLLLFRFFDFFGNSQSVSHVPSAFGGAGTRIAIPVGLSFIAFQAISYVVDVYRREIPPAASLLDFALFVAFFPHLLAGPIMRANRLIPSFHQTPDRPDKVQLAEGAELILVGLFKKVALADPIISLVTRYGADLQHTGPGTMWVLWSLGIAGAYFDITGYIDMARGSAMMLGIHLQPNSIQPLLRSTNLSDFWRRWQVTLMMWFRDYVFLPVRGRKKAGESRELLALMASFIALGLWHGLTPAWLIWGTLTGVVVTIERWVQSRRAAKRRAAKRAIREATQARAERRTRKVAGAEDADASRRSPRPTAATAPTAAATDGDPSGPWHHPAFRRVRQLFYVFLMLTLTLPWIGSPTISATIETYKVLLGAHHGPMIPDAGWMLLFALVSLLLVDGRERTRLERSGHPDPPTLLRALGFGAMLLAIIVFAGTPSQPFIYFRF